MDVVWEHNTINGNPLATPVVDDGSGSGNVPGVTYRLP